MPALDPTSKLALDTIQLGKQAIVFAPSRASAEKAAEDIAPLTSFYLPELEQQILHASSVPTKQCRKLSHCIKKGIAFHHAGLLSQQRELIETEFRKGSIKIICATPTLAAGISTPAFRVIIKSLKRFSGEWGMDWIPVLEYLQMAGRAGRPEFESFGEAITIAKDEREKKEIYDRYVCGKPEEIYSKLAVEPVLRTYLLSLIATGVIRDTKSMYDFFGKTFWAHHFKDMPKLKTIMKKMLTLLEEWEFIRIGKENQRNNPEDNQRENQGKNQSENQADFISAKEMGKNLGQNIDHFQATAVGKRISQLYIDPFTARHLLDCLQHWEKEGNKNKKSAFSLLQMISHTLEMRPLLRIKKKEEEIIQEELNKRYDFLLEPEPNVSDLEYEAFMNSIKTALFFDDWIDERDEDYLFEKYDIRPGEIRVKMDTADWLLYAAEELSTLRQWHEVLKEIRKIRVRVQHGAKEELLPLLKLRGIGRIRARKMYYNGIKDIGDVKKIDVATLRQILGEKIAEDVKKQVGEEVPEEVPKGRRKGQLSMEKF